MKRTVTLLGSTGSIGTQAIEVIEANRDDFRVEALSAGGSQLKLLAEQVVALRPAVVAVDKTGVTAELTDLIAQKAHATGSRQVSVEIREGHEASQEVAAMTADVVLNGITGAAGLLPTLAALESGATLALANKESLVIGGRLVTEAAAPGQIVPVDSEHSAFAQALRAGRREEVARLILTASGGPFRGKTRAELANVTPADALAHPTWNMGRVVTLNSASLVNKGLELIEAALLFDVDFDHIQVVVHPQSVVHSMVEFIDGSTIAQCSPPDMKLPIALGLTWPDRLAHACRPVDWSKASEWTFEPVDSEVFPAVEIARRAGKAAGSAPAVFNAANEVCVDAFCDGDLSFLGIVDVVSEVVSAHLAHGHITDDYLSVEAVLGADTWAREHARQIINTMKEPA